MKRAVCIWRVGRQAATTRGAAATTRGAAATTRGAAATTSLLDIYQ